MHYNNRSLIKPLNTNLCTADIEKLQHRSGIDSGLFNPTLKFPERRPLHICIKSSPISSMFLGSSNENGRVDFLILSIHNESEVPFVFIKCPTSCCPHTDNAHLTAVDFPIYV